MKKIISLFSIVILATILFNACDKDPLTYDEGVVINGVKWATRNIGTAGTFVTNSEDYGGYYQWNKKDTANFLFYEDYFSTDYPNANLWLLENDPSPKGWRVPDLEEIKRLLDTEKVTSEWTILNDINGCRFTDISTGKSIFMPTAGIRAGNSDDISAGFGTGGYWSNTNSNEYAHSYSLCIDESGAGYCYDILNSGLSVRCVAK
jgi:uncharacterized protein (TIGR02145 family)